MARAWGSFLFPGKGGLAQASLTSIRGLALGNFSMHSIDRRPGRGTLGLSRDRIGRSRVPVQQLQWVGWTL